MKYTKEESLVNRILINYGVAIIAYILLYFLLNKYYMKYSIVLPIAGVMLIAAVVCYLLQKKTGKTKNYGHMFIGLAAALIVTQSSFIIYRVLGEKIFSALTSVWIIDKAVNSRNATIGIAWLGAIYLVIMTVYNAVLISKEKKNAKTGAPKVHGKKK